MTRPRACLPGLLLFVGCAATNDDRTPASAILSHPPPPAAVAKPITPEPARPATPAAQLTPAPVAAPSASTKAAAPPDPQTLAHAQELVARAQKLYYAGAYDKAEASLKEATTLYPFLADANLLLGKVFLLKGSAARDVALVNSARLLFEMAHTIDPGLREAEVLLELFRQEPTD